MFPEIKTYAFESRGSPHVAGHMAVGPGGVHVAAQTMHGLMRLEPVQTVDGMTVYLSYLDANRTDGLNLPQEPSDRDHDHGPPPGGPVPQALLQGVALSAVESGDQLRVYRLAAATTG